MIPRYDTKLFTDIYDNEEDFLADWKESGLYKSQWVTDDNIKVIFFLLYASHGNDPIANLDETQFKYKMWSIIFKYGPTWEKKLDIQTQLRGLSADQIASGSKAIYNHAYNPSTAPSTASTNELPFINEQNVTKYSKGVVDAYAQLWELLTNDVTSAFINKFDNLFLHCVSPQRTAIYVTETEGEDD